ncbi:glycosyl hydrolase family 61-domain-containing protein [Elsinoe ampelina]|uniref:lytic cellulose monooxygenase (C4-dehydrogenating) n=1 Tax=Elsinoe ampelina TaxID=302913 RepID=A0A6A6G7C7_9PEZI|nr:glycosyl hydrolase family 61-domain-containing protein [Elsinoe ampelina]
MHLLPLLALAAPALAHYNFERLIVNGVATEPYEYVRQLPQLVSNSPFLDVSHPDIRCNNGSFASASRTKVFPVKPGDTVGFTIRDVLGHPGPLFAYMSRSTVADVRNYQGDGDWFKVYEQGVRTFGNYSVSMTWMVDGWRNYTFKVPSQIPNGQYLLRGEHVAVHGAGTVGGTQFYIGCAQIEVSGAAGGTPSPVGKFPGIYNARDPGIFFNPYWPPMVNYTMPGIEVYPKGGSFPPFTADPAKPVATQPLPATYARVAVATP